MNIQGRIYVGSILGLVLSVANCFSQSTQIPTVWFSSSPETVVSDPLFVTLSLETRRQILSQIDPRFAKLSAEKKEAFLWQAEKKYLPKPDPAKETFVWRSGDPSSGAEVLQFNSAVVKTLAGRGIVVSATLNRLGFLQAHVRIQNHSQSVIEVRPQTFTLEVIKPKPQILYFEYPSRVSWELLKAGFNNMGPYMSGETIASVAASVLTKTLNEGLLVPGATLEGDVYFEVNSKAQSVALRMNLSSLGFELPFALLKP